MKNLINFAGRQPSACWHDWPHLFLKTHRPLVVVRIICAFLLCNSMYAQNLSMPDADRHVLSSAPVERVDVDLVGSSVKDWKPVASASVYVVAPNRAVLISLMPVGSNVGESDKPFVVKLADTEAGVHNRWQVRYIRDSEALVGVFTLGAVLVSKSSELGLPLNLVAVDVPTPGKHSYLLEIRYVGDKSDTEAGRISIQNCRLSVLPL